MADTFTADKIAARLQTIGGNETTWGNYLNDEAITFFAAAIADYRTKSVAGSVNVTLTAAEARSAFLVLTGVLTGSISVIVPTSEGGYWIVNNTTGAFTITVKTAAGTGIVIPRGSPMLLWCDGTNVVDHGGFRLPTNHISGLILSNNGSDANNDIDLSAGRARDATDAVNMVLTASITKRLDATWAVGTNQGGLDTGAKVNGTFYAVWLIERLDTGVVDFLFSTSWVSPMMPANYDYKRLIGGVRTDGSGNLVLFRHANDYFQLLADVVDVNDNTLTAGSFETGTMTVPPYCIGNFSVLANDSGATTDMSVALRTKGSANASYRVMSDSYASKTGRQRATTVVMSVNADLQAEYAIAAEVSVAQIIIVTLGFWMPTRSMPL